MPSTYLWMLERFQTDKPEVALVEVWGINPYETYEKSDILFGDYFKFNIERRPLSWEKIEVIQDFETLDFLYENIALTKYKGRLLDNSLKKVDFNYSFDALKDTYQATDTSDVYWEMNNRFQNNGYLLLEGSPVEDFFLAQESVSPNETIEIESDILKYVDKIIHLCEEYDVELIFYRAPYSSTKNELFKVNFLKNYLGQYNIPFFNMEEHVQFDCNTDFSDVYHLSEPGARKVTNFLSQYISDTFFD